MSDLLTTKQVQDLLQVDRTTIYRMLKDGRLIGVKLGHQWRFPVQQIETLRNGRSLPTEEEPIQLPQDNLPISCFQAIQDIFTDITQIWSITTNLDGTPLTQAAANCHFCQVLLSSETGRQDCQAFWRQLAHHRREQEPFFTCHAGLHCKPAPVNINDSIVALLIAGQFYSRPPDAAEEAARIQMLARKHQLDEAVLTAAARHILILDNRQKVKMGSWLSKIATLFEHVSCERLSFVNRLQQIAFMSSVTVDSIPAAAQ